MDTASLVIAVRSDQVNDAKSAMDKATDSAASLEGMVLKVAAAFGLYKAADWVKDITLLAARYETLGIAMNTAALNIGFTAVQMSTLQLSMEKTGISMVAARQGLTMMAVAQMDLAKSTELARAAQNVAIVANMNSSDAFQTLTQSIQTGMAVTAHHLGLMVQYDKAERDLARSLGKTKEELTDREKILARTNEALRVAAGFNGLYEASMTTAGKQLLSMDRYIQNLETKVGAVFGPALSAGVTFFTNALKDMSDWMDKASKSGSLQKIAEGLGSFTGGTLNAALAPLKLMIEYSEQLKAATIAVGIAAAFAYGNQGITALASIIAPTLRMITLTVFLEMQTLRLAAAQGFAALATAGWTMAMTALLSPMALVAAGLAVLWVATSGIREETERLNAATEAQSKFRANVQDPVMNMREEAIRLRKQNAALLADGGTAGPASRQFQIDELVKGVSKGKEDQFTPEWMASARLYAAQTVDNKNALQATKDAIEGEAAARKKAEEAAALALQHRIDLMKFANDLYDKTAKSQERSADSAMRENGTLIEFVRDLDPANASAAKWAKVQEDLWWALEDGLIPNQTEYNRLLEVAKGKYTEAGQAAEAYQKRIQGGVTRLNARGDFATEVKDLNAQLAAGLSLDIYTQRMEAARLKDLQLRASVGDTWAIIGLVVTQQAGNGADALQRWMNNTDQLGRTWTTLGQTFKGVIHDMLLQMQKAIIQQQMMQPIFTAMGLGVSNAGSWLSSLFGSSSNVPGDGLPAGGMNYPGYAVGTNYVPNDGLAYLHRGEAVVPAAMNGKGGGTTNNTATVNVTVNQATGQTQADVAATSVAMGNRLKAAVLSVLDDESRQGGRLSRS